VLVNLLYLETTSAAAILELEEWIGFIGVSRN
jgi:hypothetical protein